MKYLKTNIMKTPTKLFAYTRENQYDDQYIKVPIHGGNAYSLERNPDWKSGLYIEHGMLQETDLIECVELDMEGRDEVGDLGIFRVKPEHFTVELRETYDKDKTWNKYRLTQEGWEYLESIGLKHPGRGYVSYNLITEEDLEIKREKQKKQIEEITQRLSKLNSI